MEIILLCLYGKVTVIVIFLIIYLYWIWKKVRLIKWEQAPGDTRDWIRNHEKNINKIYIKFISNCVTDCIPYKIKEKWGSRACRLCIGNSWWSSIYRHLY